jgi:hypothetical protein
VAVVKAIQRGDPSGISFQSRRLGRCGSLSANNAIGVVQ